MKNKNKLTLFSLLLFISLFTLSCERNINNNEINQNTETGAVKLPEYEVVMQKYYDQEPNFIPRAPEDGSKMAKKLEDAEKKMQQHMDSLNRAQQTKPVNVNSGAER